MVDFRFRFRGGDRAGQGVPRVHQQPEELEAYLLAEGGDAPNIEYSEDFKEKQAETQVLADLAADTTEETVYVPCILDVIPNSVANTEFGKLLPSLANGTYTPRSSATG